MQRQIPVLHEGRPTLLLAGSTPVRGGAEDGSNVGRWLSCISDTQRGKDGKTMSNNSWQRYDALGAVIKLHREHLGLQQQEAAKKIGICASFLHDIETGWRRPGMNRVAKIAEVLEIDTDTLYIYMGVLPPDIAASKHVGIILDVFDELRLRLELKEQSDKLDSKKESKV
jgi:DNA-binding XRE family transcriptional regulator